MKWNFRLTRKAFRGWAYSFSILLGTIAGSRINHGIENKLWKLIGVLSLPHLDVYYAFLDYIKFLIMISSIILMFVLFVAIVFITDGYFKK